MLGFLCTLITGEEQHTFSCVVEIGNKEALHCLLARILELEKHPLLGLEQHACDQRVTHELDLAELQESGRHRLVLGMPQLLNEDQRNSESVLNVKQ